MRTPLQTVLLGMVVFAGASRLAHAGPVCPEDVNDDLTVNVSDLLAVISAWGNCPAPPSPATCPADFNDDGVVNVTDLLTVISNWG